MAVFSRLLPVAASAYGLQMFFAAVFVPLQTDMFFDLGGALGWFSTALLSLYYPTLKGRSWNGLATPFPPLSSFPTRQLLLNAAVGLWSIRLGSYLSARAIKNGGDSRFVTIKKDPRHFSGLWLGQATWIMVVGLPIWLVNTLPASASPTLGPRDYIALGLWAVSFLFEVVADRQKAAWQVAKQRKQHDEKFIISGLWSLSRHPNYLGEIGLWAGIGLLASKSLQSPYFPKGTIALAAISPIFTWFLISKVSGVPSLERVGEKKFGSDPKWQEYKRNVPVLFPWGSR